MQFWRPHKGTQEVWHAVTTAITSRVAKYSLPKKEQALIHITNIDKEKKEVAVANMWKLSMGQDSSLWKDELDRTSSESVPLTLKRKPEHFDEMVESLFGPAKKRVHSSFNASATLATP